jgi:hypothetical protein
VLDQRLDSSRTYAGAAALLYELLAMSTVPTLSMTVPVCSGGGILDLRGRRLSARVYVDSSAPSITGFSVRGGVWSNRMLVAPGEISNPVSGSWLLLDVPLGDRSELQQAREIGIVVQFRFTGPADEAAARVWLDNVQIE